MAAVTENSTSRVPPGEGDNQRSNQADSRQQEQHRPRNSQENSADQGELSANRGASLSPSEVTTAAMAKRKAKHHNKWNRRLKLFFCCLGYKKNRDSIHDVASIFAEFFSDLDAPSSDIAAGFVLLSKYQAAQRQWILKQPHLGVDLYLSGIPIDGSTKFLDISSAEDSHLVNDLIYYMNYSLAIFGWPLHMVDDPCMLCCIYPYLRLSPCCGGGGGGGCGKRHKKPPKDKEQKAVSKKDKKADEERTDKKDDSSIREKRRSSAGKSDKVTTELARDSQAAGVAASEVLATDRTEVSGAAKCNGQQCETSARGSHDVASTRRCSGATSTPGQLSDDCDTPIILEDNCCSCNAASAERRLARHNYEIIYISYRSNVAVVPFLVAADHAKQTIVVAIRGSMNLADMVTDLNGTVDKVPIDDCPDDWLCHRGITGAAAYVRQQLRERRILELAFNCRPDLGSQEYGLVICGHSLGAGAAAILGVLLRRQYPALKAYLYSPPGGILSMPVVEYTKEFAVGIILGNDTVARLGVAQLERLRYHSLLSLKSAQKSPGKILTRALCPYMCCGANEVEYDPEQSLDLLNGTSGRSFDYNNKKIPFQVQPQILYVPGRLIHIVKNYSFRTKTQRFWSGPIYQAVWTDNAIYDRVMISEGMFLDHLPNNVMHAMKMLFSRTLPARRDSKLSTSGAGVVESPPGEGVVSSEQEVSVEDVKTIDSEDDRAYAGEDDQLAQAKTNVIEDDNNNNDYSTREDMNNNHADAKLYPNLNRPTMTHSN